MRLFSLLYGTPRRVAQDVAAATVVGVFLGVIGPFGSYYGGGIERRIVYWTLNLWVGYAAISACSRLSLAVAQRLDLPFWFSLAFGVAAGALPLALLVRGVSLLVWPPSRQGGDPLVISYLQCLAIAEPLSFLYVLGLRRSPLPSAAAPADLAAQADVSPEATAAPAPDAFLSRLPPRLGRDLLCLAMEDHYVRAHTALGSDLILMPLKEAIAALGQTEGLQVHRSHWVARAAVAEVLQDGRAVSLRLVNDLVVPVSRTSVARLKSAGWL